MLREFSKVEQRHDAVLAVIREGMRVSDVAEKFGGIETRCTPGWPLTRPKPSRASGTDRGGPRPHRLRPPLLLQAALPIGRRLRRRLGRAVGAWRSLVATRRDPVRTPPTWLPRFRRHHLAQQIRVDGKVARNGQPGDQLPIRGVIQFLRETSGLCRPHTNSIRSVVDLATHMLSSSTLLPLDHSYRRHEDHSQRAYNSTATWTRKLMSLLRIFGINPMLNRPKRRLIESRPGTPRFQGRCRCDLQRPRRSHYPKARTDVTPQKTVQFGCARERLSVVDSIRSATMAR